MKVKYTVRAGRDIKRLRDFIAKKNPLAAQKASQQLKKQIRYLVKHPDMGVDQPQLGQVQQLIAREFIVRYVVEKDMILIVNVWHEKEDR